jgi:hypothetical protein
MYISSDGLSLGACPARARAVLPAADPKPVQADHFCDCDGMQFLEIFSSVYECEHVTGQTRIARSRLQLHWMFGSNLPSWGGSSRRADTNRKQPNKA